MAQTESSQVEDQMGFILFLSMPMSECFICTCIHLMTVEARRKLQILWDST